jgi:hypothetical protein
VSTRPGTPESVTDILTEILAELRAIRAQLGQPVTVETVTVETVTEAVHEYIEDALPGRAVR